MSNIKDIYIHAVVPFTWMTPKSDWAPEGLPVEDVATVATWLLAPAMGLSHFYTSVGYLPNDRGGKTAMYQLQIEGNEAVSFAALDHFCEIIERAGGWVEQMMCDDIEDGHDHSSYRSPVELRLGEQLEVSTV